VSTPYTPKRSNCVVAWAYLLIGLLGSPPAIFAIVMLGWGLTHKPPFGHPFIAVGAILMYAFFAQGYAMWINTIRYLRGRLDARRAVHLWRNQFVFNAATWGLTVLSALGIRIYELVTSPRTSLIDMLPVGLRLLPVLFFGAIITWMAWAVWRDEVRALAWRDESARREELSRIFG
jgi:hypothetical protein